MTPAKSHCVYRLFGVAGELLYVGCTSNLQLRLKDHRASKWFIDAYFIIVSAPMSRSAALFTELAVIASEQPLHNIIGAGKYRPTPLLKDEKGAFYSLTYAQIIAHYGTAAEAARRLKVTRAAVASWKKSGISLGRQAWIMTNNATAFPLSCHRVAK